MFSLSKSYEIMDIYENVTIHPPSSTLQFVSFGFQKIQMSNIVDSSTIIFDDTSLVLCLGNTLSPWTNCQIPDTVNFTIVQLLPKLDTIPTYFYSTDVFRIPTTQTSPTLSAYLLKGTLNFSRTYLELYKAGFDGVSVNLNVSQSYLGVNTIYNSTATEILYKKIVIASILNTVAQFNSTSFDLSQASYSWTQLRDFIVNAALPIDYGSYSKGEFVCKLVLILADMISRLTDTIQFWIYTNNEKDFNQTTPPITINVSKGQRINVFMFGPTLLTAAICLVVWIVFIIIIMISIAVLGRKRNLKLISLQGELKIPKGMLEEMWQNAYGLLISKRRLGR